MDNLQYEVKAISILKNNIKMRHRTIIKIHDDYDKDLLKRSLLTFKEMLNFEKIYWYTNEDKKEKIYSEKTIKIVKVNKNNTLKFLGTSVKLLIFEDFYNSSPNDIFRLWETVEGPGVIILILPKCVDDNSFFNVRLSSILNNKYQNFFYMTEEILTLINVQIDDLKITEDLSMDNKLVSKTEDQKKCVEECVNILKNKSIINKGLVTSITAPRGRGKSYSIVLIILESINLGYKNILLTGNDLLALSAITNILYNYLNQSFEVKKVIRKNEGENYIKSITVNNKINISIIEKRSKVDDIFCDLLFIDEAAAIPQTQLHKFLKYPKIFLLTTVDGYEGTGRNYTYRLENYLKDNYTFYKIVMEEPIRYGKDDPVEDFLKDALLLNFNYQMEEEVKDLSNYELYKINKRVLFSGNEDQKSEKVLQKIIGLLIMSHYKNTPADFKTIADYPHHELFVLADKNNLDNIYTVIQIAYEGGNDCYKSTEGNIIPWTIDPLNNLNFFIENLGIRIVRISTMINYQSKGLGSLAISKINNLSNIINLSNSINLDKDLLFISSKESLSSNIKWIGTSFGLTHELAKFWGRNNFIPIFINTVKSKSSGSFHAIYVKPFSETTSNIKFNQLSSELCNKFINLCPLIYRNLKIFTVLEVIAAFTKIENQETFTEIERNVLFNFIKVNGSLKSILHLIPKISRFYFNFKSNKCISVLAKVILACLGLQCIEFDDISQQFHLPIDSIYRILKFNLKIIISEIISK